MVETNGRPAVAEGDERISDSVVLSRATANLSRNDDDAADEWLPRVSKDRPVYGCPKCSESAMQFYAEHPLFPHRSEFFHCHGCGTCWEM